MDAIDAEHLRVLIANDQRDELALVEALVSLGHDVLVARDPAAEGVLTLIHRRRPDVALVGPGSGAAETLALIDRIVREASCPVILVVHEAEPDLIRKAAKAGVFAYLSKDEPRAWPNTIEFVVHRFAEYRRLEEAFNRRVVIERAKGILMERHAIDEDRAFALIRAEARATNRRVVYIARAVVEGHLLLSPVRKAPGPARVGHGPSSVSNG